MFSKAEVKYLGSQVLARVATADVKGRPNVAVVGFEFDGECFYIGSVTQKTLRSTPRYLNVKRGNRRVALVVDDLVSLEPWKVRGIRVNGVADIVLHKGEFGTGEYIRIKPKHSWSWGLSYESAKTGPKDCIFCRIVKKEIPASIVYEDEDVMALMDLNPVQEGHTLVIPKRHFADIQDIEPAQLAKVDAVAQRVARKMATALKAQGVNTFSASGKSAGQEILHFHMHVIPLKKGEKTKFAEWWLSKARRAERAELEALAETLRL